MSFNYSLFDTLLEPVFILNDACKIVYCNEPASLLVSSTVRKLMRTQPVLSDLFQFSDSIEALTNLSVVTDPTPYKEVNFTTSEGNAGKVQVTLQKLPETQHWILFMRDVTLEERLQKKYRAELDAKEDVITELKKAQAELENYSRNLEKMVDERTTEIRGLNQKLKALLDSLNQGFLIFDQSGVCWEVTSKACEDVLESHPAGHKIWDVLKLPSHQKEGFEKWLKTLFMEMLPFEDLVPLGPSIYSHSRGRHIELNYYPIRNAQKQIEALVLVASDTTDLIEARDQAEKEKAHAGFILKMFQQKRAFLSFFDEAERLMQEFAELTTKDSKYWDKEALFRVLHTLKGGSASYSLRDVAKTVHELETIVTQLLDSSSKFDSQKWHVCASTLASQYGNFKNEVQQLLGPLNQSKAPTVEVLKPELQKVLDLLESWSKTKDWAQELKAHYLTEPLQASFDSFNYLLQRTAEQLSKKVMPLRYETPEFRWNYEPYKAFMGTLVHVFRNAIDHGIETPEERGNLGKPDCGEIKITALDLGREIKLIISDDGRGLNLFKIKQKMVEKGLDVSHLSPRQIAMQIFEPQFSTNSNITELSGRGVGLDAVKSELNKLGGRVDLEFEENKGTKFIFWLPKTQEPGISSKAA